MTTHKLTAEQPVYPAPGSTIPDQPGYVVGKCTHRVAKSDWRAGFRVCERCPYPSTDQPADAEAPTMTMAELRQALRGPDRLLTDDECQLALVWLLSYSAEYGRHSRGREIHRALALAVKSQLDARSGGAR